MVRLRVCISGVKGFKGTWLAHLLSQLGHKVYGIDNNASPSRLFEESHAAGCLESLLEADIRDYEAIHSFLVDSTIDVMIHMAALPIVLDSFDAPQDFFDVNVVGMLRAVEAAEAARGVIAQIVVTSDKVFLPSENEITSFGEEAPRGGKDPYSASKASCDFLIEERVSSDHSWRSKVAIVRAGNVVGFGDSSRHRLFPEILEALRNEHTLVVRSPDAVRPWQSVLDCLGGYIRVMQGIVGGEIEAKLSKWNFGPMQESSSITVRDIVTYCSEIAPLRVDFPELKDNRETAFLRVDPSKAHREMQWKPVFGIHDVIDRAVEPAFSSLSTPEIVRDQIEEFLGKSNYLL